MLCCLSIQLKPRIYIYEIFLHLHTCAQMSVLFTKDIFRYTVESTFLLNVKLYSVKVNRNNFGINFYLISFHQELNSILLK